MHDKLSVASRAACSSASHLAQVMGDEVLRKPKYFAEIATAEFAVRGKSSSYRDAVWLCECLCKSCRFLQMFGGRHSGARGLGVRSISTKKFGFETHSNNITDLRM